MLMTQTELNNLFGQVNAAFKEQSDRLKELKNQLDQLEERLNGYEKDPKLARAGVSGYNKPKRTPNHPTKKFVVVAKVGDKTKTIRFGDAKMTIKRANRLGVSHFGLGTSVIQTHLAN